MNRFAILRYAAILGVLVLTPVSAGRGEEPAMSTTQPVFALTSTAFTPGATIPVKHTGDGADTSPPLAWTAPPEGTKSLALICDDPDAPRGTWVHWVLFNIPVDTRLLPEGVAKKAEPLPGATQGVNDFGKTGYNGPAPPKGPVHHYSFRLYALDIALTLKADAKKADLVKAIEGHILAQTGIVGVYKR